VNFFVASSNAAVTVTGLTVMGDPTGVPSVRYVVMVIGTSSR
jgi:hypothetical protein